MYIGINDGLYEKIHITHSYSIEIRLHIGLNAFYFLFLENLSLVVGQSIFLVFIVVCFFFHSLLLQFFLEKYHFRILI